MSQHPLSASVAASQLFRELMSRFPTGVTVTTALDPKGRPYGMTASAVAALSLEPPLVLVCVDQTADLHAILCDAPAFGLSVLAADQEALSRRFAEELPNRFDGVPFSPGVDGLPLLDGALAHITCRKWGQFFGGDHTIFIGQVNGGAIFERKPLIHFRRTYGTTQ
jgi:flavin reductase (DIM6/NTAB) family NADH-FMN oxidoreductase RutF